MVVIKSQFYTHPTNMYHDEPPVCITVLFAEVSGSGVGGGTPKVWSFLPRYTILTEMMADEFNFSRPEIKNYKAEADTD